MAAKKHQPRTPESIVAKSCLIATDVDKTILAQSGNADDEKNEFVRSLAPALVDAARLGVNICFLTGNSMKQLASRMLQLLVRSLCARKEIRLLEKFHFFCNAGGVYAHFSETDSAVADLVKRDCVRREHLEVADVMDVLTKRISKKEIVIRPRFLDRRYLVETLISSEELARIETVLGRVGRRYAAAFKAKAPALKKSYDVEKFLRDGKRRTPQVHRRMIEFGGDSDPDSGSVQLTLKPILSFHYANPRQKTRIAREQRDLRSKFIREINEELREDGLSSFVARAGGRTSIDVTSEFLDKKFALEHLIWRLGVKGVERNGEKPGTNTIYLGDEVLVGGGNDYAVRHIPGLLVLAVNEEKALVPFAENIYIPHELFAGPEASSYFLKSFVVEASSLYRECQVRGKDYSKGNAVVAYKRKLFGNRIRNFARQTDRLTADELQMVHALVSLMSRRERADRNWVSIVTENLDAIMKNLAERHGFALDALIRDDGDIL